MSHKKQASNLPKKLKDGAITHINVGVCLIGNYWKRSAMNAIQTRERVCGLKFRDAAVKWTTTIAPLSETKGMRRRTCRRSRSRFICV